MLRRLVDALKRAGMSASALPCTLFSTGRPPRTPSTPCARASVRLERSSIGPVPSRAAPLWWQTKARAARRCAGSRPPVPDRIRVTLHLARDMATPYAEDSLARSFQKRAALTFGRECDGAQSRLASSARVFSLSGSSQAQGRARVLRVGPPAQNDQRCCQAQKP